MSTDEKIIKNKVGLLKLSEMGSCRHSERRFCSSCGGLLITEQ
jgi:hypothetical protein